MAEPEPAPVFDRLPRLGQGVTFVLDGGIIIAGMDELAAIVTKVVSPTVVCLTVLPLTSDIFWRENVHRQDDKHPRACWKFSDGDLANDVDAEDMKALKATRGKEWVEMINETTPPRRRGRPPKPVAAA